ncbi:MAG: hypothetical protein HY075_04235 [Deltaproteobacteria bacterium]|nr:hypothetical protein [Deltaproteobacteria bacterium]
MMLAFFAAFIFSPLPQAHAFVEMVRHGYFNCIACHASPTGGGLLTTYGRALSKEALSHGTFFFEKKAPAPVAAEETSKEEDFLHGAAPLPGWLLLGGDVRLLQAYSDTRSATDVRAILMQLDLEGRAEYKRLSMLATAGRQEPPANQRAITDSLISRRHWLSAKLGADSEPDVVQVRAGRFFPAYGLNIPEHNIVTRRGLGFEQGEETYNAEAAYLGEGFNVYATAIFGRPDAASLKSRRGAAVQVARAVGTMGRVGLNGYTGVGAGDSEKARRNLVGANAAIAFTPKHYALLEVDGDHSVASAWGGAEYFKIAWELDQGLHLFVDQEHQRRAFQAPDQVFESARVRHGGLDRFSLLSLGS